MDKDELLMRLIGIVEFAKDDRQDYTLEDIVFDLNELIKDL